MLKFIHLADTHLGFKYKYLNDKSSKIIEKQKEAIRMVFKFALDKEVDAIIHAGDVFDLDIRSEDELIFLRSEMYKLSEKNIKFFFVTGNHDPKGIELFNDLENVYQFNISQATTYEMQDYTVTGISQKLRDERDPMQLISKASDNGKFNILILHTILKDKFKVNNPHMPSNLSDLKNSGYDYIALGHVHKRMELNSNPPIIYPGSTFAKTKKELGEKGFYYITYDNHILNKEFIKASDVQFVEDSVEVTDNFKNELSQLFYRYDSNILLNLKIIARIDEKNKEDLYSYLNFLKSQDTVFNLDYEVEEKFLIDIKDNYLIEILKNEDINKVYDYVKQSDNEFLNSLGKEEFTQRYEKYLEEIYLRLRG